jgi:hypothetical protein
VALGDGEVVVVVVEKSEAVIGMEMDNLVAEKLVSSCSSGHESLALGGHSSKKGRSVWFSCFTESTAAVVVVTKSLPKKDSGSLSVLGREQIVVWSRSLSVPSIG